MINQYAAIRPNDLGRPSAPRQLPERQAPAPPRTPKASIFDWRTDKKVIEIRGRLDVAKSKEDELRKTFDDTKLEVTRAEDRLSETKGLRRMGLLGDADVTAAEANLERADEAHEQALARLAVHERESKTDRAIARQIEDQARVKAQKSVQDAYRRAVRRLHECLAAVVETDEEVGLIHEFAAAMFPSDALRLAPGRVRIPSCAGLMFARWPRHMLTSEAFENWVKQRREEGLL